VGGHGLQSFPRWRWSGTAPPGAEIGGSHVRELKDRVAVVTGAASGIGLGIVDACVAAGMKVMLADVDAGRLETQRARLEAGGAEVAAMIVDVGDGAQVESLAGAVVSRFGAVHVVCNNAGIVRRGRTWELSVADWDAVMRVNLMGVVHGVRSFVPRLLAQGDEGHVVNMASMSAVVPVLEISPYNVSKAGVLALSDILKAELAAIEAPIGVTVVMPGRVRTRLGMTPDDPGDGPPDDVLLQPGVQVLDPANVGRQVVDAIVADQLYLFTHPGRVADAVARFARITDRPG
jgi:NAD(P)-dependent dehydrogenase (short-subunit alcohol dehydrogenase family)